MSEVITAALMWQERRREREDSARAHAVQHRWVAQPLSNSGISKYLPSQIVFPPLSSPHPPPPPSLPPPSPSSPRHTRASCCFLRCCFSSFFCPSGFRLDLIHLITAGRGAGGLWVGRGGGGSQASVVQTCAYTPRTYFEYITRRRWESGAHT